MHINPDLRISRHQNEIVADLRKFFERADAVGAVYNEAALQMELGCFLRLHGYQIEFERPFKTKSLPGTTRRPKRELDLLLVRDDYRTAIELKVPLAGRVPECMYDFVTDITFVQGLIRDKIVDMGFALLVTNNRQFWYGRSEGIYAPFRDPVVSLTGRITKPTGASKDAVVLSASYNLAANWQDVENTRLLANARYLLLGIGSGDVPT